jgi:hypothetical protein
MTGFANVTDIVSVGVAVGLELGWDFMGVYWRPRQRLRHIRGSCKE